MGLPQVAMDESAMGVAITRYIEIQSKALRQEREEKSWLVVPVFRSGPVPLRSTAEVLEVASPDRVVKLELTGDQITDETLAVAIRQFPNLRFVRLYVTAMTGAGLQQLVQCRHLMSVDLLYNCGITTNAAAELTDRLPEVIIRVVVPDS